MQFEGFNANLVFFRCLFYPHTNNVPSRTILTAKSCIKINTGINMNMTIF